MIIAEGYAYEIIENVREGFQQEAFSARYSDILTKYDYIVGDWGYGQLRLKGFFDDKNQNAIFGLEQWKDLPTCMRNRAYNYKNGVLFNCFLRYFCIFFVCDN